MAKLRVDKIASVGVSTETTGSVFFDDSGDYLAIPIGTDFDLGTADFTIELWWYKADSGNQYAWTLGDSKLSTGLELYVGTSGTETKIYTNNGPQLTAATNPAANEWHHYAVVRENGTLKLYIDGVQDPSTYDASSNDFGGAGGFLYIGVEYYNSGFNYDGLKYISNFRVCKGHAVYKSNFAVPTRELDVHPGPDDDRTVFLGLYDGENIFADKTGRHNHEIAAYGDRLSSPTPTAYASQNWLTLPKGTTTERYADSANNAVDAGSSSARGIFHQGQTPTRVRSLDFVSLPTLGDAQDFGDLLASPGGRDGTGSLASSTRGIFAGGRDTGGTQLDDIEFITIATQGDAQIFGDLSATRRLLSGLSNSTRGVFVGGFESPTNVDTMEYITIATTGDTTDFGNIISGARGMGAFASPVKGVFGGGYSPSASVNTINFITISSTGNSQDFGDLILNRNEITGASNSTRGLFAGGYNPAHTNIIQYVTIQSSGNAFDFGDLLNTRNGQGGAASSTRALFAGGYDGSVLTDDIYYVNIATTGNAVSFGELIPSGTNQTSGCSNGHGGLG